MTIKVKSISIVDKALSGIELNNETIQIFKQGGMIKEIDIKVGSLKLE